MQLKILTTILGAHVPRVFRFVDILERELHMIDDPEDKLPVPRTTQVISIGLTRMQVESVKLSRTDSGAPSVYDVRVRVVPVANERLFKN